MPGSERRDSSDPNLSAQMENWGWEGADGALHEQSSTYGLTAISIFASRTDGAGGTGGTGSTRGAGRAGLTTVTLRGGRGRGGGRADISVDQHSLTTPTQHPTPGHSPWDQQHRHDRGHLQHREHPMGQQDPPKPLIRMRMLTKGGPIAEPSTLGCHEHIQPSPYLTASFTRGTSEARGAHGAGRTAFTRGT